MDCDTVCDVSVVSIDFKVVNPDVGVVVGVNPYYNGSMERKCGVCGTTFKVPAAWIKRGSGKFCSKDCYATHQRRNPHTRRGKTAIPSIERICACGVTFTTLGSKPKKFCSRTCPSRKRHLVCIDCGSAFTMYPSQHSTRCPDCRRPKFSACKTCGKMFASKRGRLTHCSEECRRPPVTTICPTCGVEFRYTPGDRQRFCTVRCYRRYTGETEPERNVRLSLTELGIPFEQEAVVGSWRYPVDFLLRERNTVLEVDGVYWHSNNRGSDARKDRFMQSQGLTVVRIADTEFYGDFSEPMVKAIRQALAIAEQCVATANLASLQPLQLALPFDEERMVRGGGDLASA